MTKHEMKIMKLEIAIPAQEFIAGVMYNRMVAAKEKLVKAKIKYETEEGKITQLKFRLEQLKSKKV